MSVSDLSLKLGMVSHVTPILADAQFLTGNLTQEYLQCSLIFTVFISVRSSLTKVSALRQQVVLNSITRAWLVLQSCENFSYFLFVLIYNILGVGSILVGRDNLQVLVESFISCHIRESPELAQKCLYHELPTDLLFMNANGFLASTSVSDDVVLIYFLWTSGVLGLTQERARWYETPWSKPNIGNCLIEDRSRVWYF